MRGAIRRFFLTWNEVRKSPRVGEGSFEPRHPSSCVPTAVTILDEPLKVALGREARC
jgi:hypothetical protein